MPTSPPSSPADTDSLEVNFEELLRTLDAHFASLPTAQFERFSFELDGIAVEVRRIKQETGDRFLITAMLGYMPFSIESRDRRQAVRAIVEATRALPKVHFAIDPGGKITAGAVFDLDRQAVRDLVFYPLMLFLQETRPFMQLIGRYMQPLPGEAAG